MNLPVKQKCIMIIAGEASGDLHGARLVQAIRTKGLENYFFCGIGGDHLKAAGVRILVEASELAVVGITEAVANAKKLLGGIKIAKGTLKNLRPDLLILIDFPDFNLHIAGAAKKIGIPVLYYISPQIWAWRQGRVKKIKRLVDHMAVILPFEETFYTKAGVPVTFVGHPLLDGEKPIEKNAEKEGQSDKPVIGLLPGSREGEVRRHLPIMLESAKVLSKRKQGLKFVLSVVPTLDKNIIDPIVEQHGHGIDMVSETREVSRVFEQCNIVIAASGTVTLEAAIAGVPLVVIYKVSRTTYWLVKTLIRVDHVCLVNLIAGKSVVPELLQSDASPSTIADTVLDLISDPMKLDRFRNDLADVRHALGKGGASQRTADIALRMMG